MKKTKLVPYYYQREAVEAVFDHCEENHGSHPIVVIPTGAGKSFVQALIVKRMLSYEETRILLLTHRAELIKQNYNELIENLDNDMFLDIGIYSAGLNCRDTLSRILFAGIQSVWNRAWHLGFFDLILVDECHRISNKAEGGYRHFFAESEKINPKIVIVGLTATQYRKKHGLLTDGKDALFDTVCYEATVKELIDPSHIKNKDKKQFLSNLISKNGVNKVDLTGVHTIAGDYVQTEMEAAFKRDNLVHKAVIEIKALTSDRKKILIFSAGIKHCEEVVTEMTAQGLNARCVHSKQSNLINDQNISDFKDGIFQYLVNVDSLTEGFNEKGIDCIVLLRSTKSPGLYYQMVGRGFRLFPGKENCLILDFGTNIDRLGPIDAIEIIRKKDGTGEVRTAPVKECPECKSLVAISVMICPDCGYKFPESEKHKPEASSADILTVWKKPETFDVEYVTYARHSGKKGKLDTLRVNYHINMFFKYSEWICVEHTGYAKNMANNWFRNRLDLDIFPIPETIDEAIAAKDFFKKTLQIIVNTNGEMPRIVGHILETEAEKLKRENKKQQEQQQEEYSQLEDLAF